MPEQEQRIKQKKVEYQHEIIDPQKLDENSLRVLLTTFYIPLDKWGKNGSKTISNLLQELSVGESQLHAYGETKGTITKKELLRKVDKVRIRTVYRDKEGNWSELYQIFTEDSQGNPIIDDQPINSGVLEKRTSRENIPDAIKRAFKQELHIGLTDEEVSMILKYGAVTQRRKSSGFPGLPTLYTIHPRIYFMPDSYYKDEYFFEEETGLKGKFIWQPIEDISECFYLNRKFGIKK